MGGFFTESVTKRHLFVSVHDAVLYCQNHRGAATMPSYEEYDVGHSAFLLTQISISPSGSDDLKYAILSNHSMDNQFFCRRFSAALHFSIYRPLKMNHIPESPQSAERKAISVGFRVMILFLTATIHMWGTK